MKQASLGVWHSACITEDGSLYTWGDNWDGRLGDGTTENKSVPTKIEIPTDETETISIIQEKLIGILAENPGVREISLTELVPGAVYNYYVFRTLSTGNLLESSNILYITQFTPDINGSAEISVGTIDGVEGEEMTVSAYVGEIYTLGDVNQDGMTDASDASQILGIYAVYSTGGTPEETEEQLLSADVNGDGMVDASDASTVLAYYAYLSTGGTVDIETFMSA